MKFSSDKIGSIFFWVFGITLFANALSFGATAIGFAKYNTALLIFDLAFIGLWLFKILLQKRGDLFQTPTSRIGFFFSLTAIIWVFASIPLCGWIHGLTFGSFRKSVFYSLYIIVLFCFAIDRPSKNALFFQFGGALTSSVCFSFAFFLKIGATMAGNGLSKSLILNYSNPNALGLALIFTLSSLLLGPFLFRKPLPKILSTLPTPVLLYLLFLSGARGSWTGCALGAFAFIFAILLRKQITKLFKPSTVASMLVVSPLAFVILYYALCLSTHPEIVNGIPYGVAGDVESGLLSRVGIWNQSIKTFWQSPIWGNYGAITEFTGESQAHNSAVDAFAAFGLVGYLLISGCEFISFSSLFNHFRKTTIAKAGSIGLIVALFSVRLLEASFCNSTIYPILFLTIMSTLPGENDKGATNE